MAKIERPKWTFIFIGACFAVFLGRLALPLEGFMFVPSLAYERPWTFVTSIFMHADPSHLLFNMFALFIFGIQLESVIGRRLFIILFFAAGIIGNFGYMATAASPNSPGLGASGAIFGIIGAFAAIRPLAMVYIGYAPMPMIFAAFLWGATEFLGLFVPSNIARGAHLGGLFLGIAYGLVYRISTAKKPENKLNL